MTRIVYGTLTMDICGLGYCLGASRDDCADHYPDADLDVCGPLPAAAVRAALDAWGGEWRLDWITDDAMAILREDTE